MTIHLFEGFFGPDYRPQAPTLFPTAVSGLFSVNTDGWTWASNSYYSNATWYGGAYIGTQQGVPTGNKLVFGLRFKNFTNPLHHITLMLLEAPQISSSYGSTSNISLPARSPLPAFWMKTTTPGTGLTGSGLRTPNTAVTVAGTNPTSIVNWNLEGLDTRTNEYCVEVEYDFQNNLINIWIDGFKVQEYSYVFTEAQKAIQVLYPAVESHTRHLQSGSSAGSSSYTLKHVHFSDEVLGNVQVKQLAPTGDFNVDSAYNAPAFSKFANYNAGVTTTKTAKMLLDVADVTDESILAFNLIGTFSKSHVSAYETISTEKLLISDGTTENAGPANAVEKGARDFMMLEKNPITGSNWTQSQINQLKIGVDLTITDKFPRS